MRSTVNGWTVSVMRSPHHYSGRTTSEVGFWKGDGPTVIRGWQRDDQIDDLIDALNAGVTPDDAKDAGY